MSSASGFTFANGDVRLAGTLALPDAAAPSPGVVLVGGSGPSDRDNDTFFPPIRRHLVAAGIAVLSYDKRGVGESSGDWRDGTLDNLASDATAALDALRAQPEVRPDAVGFFGHSEGGWVVLRAARDVPWVVTNSCPAVTPAVQMRHSLLTALHDRDDDETARTLTLYDRLVEAARRGLDAAGATQVYDAAGRPDLIADHYWDGADERIWEFLRRKQDHDPIPDALSLRCPHLAIFGGADPLVPVADSVALFAAAARDRDHQATLTVEAFPGADHRLQVEGSPAPGYLNALSRWIMTRSQR